MRDKILLALDVSSREDAIRLVKELHDIVGMFKVGSQLFLAAGPVLIREIVEMGGKVFLDLKFHDIPNTVIHAATEAAKLGVSMMTFHAAGGRLMMQSVVTELSDRFPGKRPLLVAVTVLTSLNNDLLSEVGVDAPVNQQVRKLALLARESGMDGVVCSPQEIEMLRKTTGPNFKLVTPGIRMVGGSVDDQQRIATPKAAIAAGADYIVVGRAVTSDPDPRNAMFRLLASL
jgi:orotidine-5'-phosphate decarboxylase